MGLSWERIQLFVHLTRSVDSASLGEERLELRARDAERRPLRERPVSPQAWPDRRIARFNVFVDDHQMPLDAGVYELVVRTSDASTDSHHVPVGHDFASDQQVREFPWHDLAYRVAVAAADPGRPFAIEISVVESTERRERREQRAWPASVASRIRRARRRLWVRLFNLVVVMLGRLPRRSSAIVFTSDSRSGLGGNLKLVHDRLIERGFGRRLRLRTIFKPSIRIRRSLVDRARLVWLLACADVILLDDYQPAIYRLPQRHNQRIIQLWHAWGAFKTVGYSRIGKPGAPSPWSDVHKNYTHATVSSAHEVPFYAEAFGLPDERVVPTGTPRMDDFLDPDRQATRRDRARALVPAAAGREVILFAPTFRGVSARNADYPVEMLDIRALDALTIERDAVFLVRMHPFVRSRIDVPAHARDRIIEASDLDIDTNDLLLISDLLVTDYSSLVFEFASLGRPMLFFAYDQDEYIASRDFYEPYETFVPGAIVRSFDELLRAIRERDYQEEKVVPFARRHLPSEPGSATDRIIDQLIVG